MFRNVSWIRAFSLHCKWRWEKVNQAVCRLSYTSFISSSDSTNSLTYFTRKIEAIRVQLRLLPPDLPALVHLPVLCTGCPACLSEGPHLHLCAGLFPLCRLKGFIMLSSFLCLIGFCLSVGSFLSVYISIYTYSILLSVLSHTSNKIPLAWQFLI